MCMKWTLDMLVILHCRVVSSLLCPTEGLTTVSVELVRFYPGVDKARSYTGMFSASVVWRAPRWTWLWTPQQVVLSGVELNISGLLQERQQIDCRSLLLCSHW